MARAKISKTGNFVAGCGLFFMVLLVGLVIFLFFFGGDSKEDVAKTATLELALDTPSPWLRLSSITAALGKDPKQIFSSADQDCAQPRNLKHFPADCHYSYPAGLTVTTVLDSPLSNWRDSRVIKVSVMPPFQGTIHGLHLGDSNGVVMAKANELGASVQSISSDYSYMSWGPEFASPSSILGAPGVKEWSIFWNVDVHNRVERLEMNDGAYNYVSEKP